MKKQNVILTGLKLKLGKKTISNLNNLDPRELNAKMGGGKTAHGRKCLPGSAANTCNTGPDTTFC